MVTEESSVVAAAAFAAKFWANHGGFNTKIMGTMKNGQLYFSWNGASEKLQQNFHIVKEKLLAATKPVMANMEARGGGIYDIILKKNVHQKNDYYVIHVDFETVDSMGANLINTCLEAMGYELIHFSERYIYRNRGRNYYGHFIKLHTRVFG